MNPKVDFYFNKDTKWQQEIGQLRRIVRSCNLVEELKWGCPCYLSQEKNIVLIHIFKDYCALLFFKGALLSNQNGLLIQQTKNVQAARQIRFTNLQQVLATEAAIKAHIFEAIDVERNGLKIEFKSTEEFKMPVEFKAKLDENTELNTAFNKLTPGRQRAYLLHFSSPKQVKNERSQNRKSNSGNS